MKILLQALVFTSIFVILPSAFSRAQSVGTDDPVMRDEVTTEQAEPVKELISTPRAFYNFLKSHYDDGLVFESRGGNFKVKALMRLQFQFSSTDGEITDVENIIATGTEFFFRRIRLKFNGHAFRPWLKYLIQVSRDDVKLNQLGNSSGIELKDAFFDAAYSEKIFPRIGQFKVPFNREELNSGFALLLVERSIVNQEFAIARDRGAALYGILGEHLAYGVGAFLGNGTRGTEEGSASGSDIYVGRVQLNFGGTLKYHMGNFPTGGDYALIPDFTKVPVLVFGAALVGMPDLNTKGKTTDSGALIARFNELGITKGKVVSFASDVSYKLPMYNVEAAYLGRWITPDEGGTETVYDQGLRIQTGLFLVPNKIELAGRWAFIDYDSSPGIAAADQALSDTSMELTSGITYYITKNGNWKIQLSYSFFNNTFTQGAPDTEQKTLRIQFQAMF